MWPRPRPSSILVRGNSNQASSRLLSTYSVPDVELGASRARLLRPLRPLWGGTVMLLPILQGSRWRLRGEWPCQDHVSTKCHHSLGAPLPDTEAPTRSSRPSVQEDLARGAKAFPKQTLHGGGMSQWQTSHGLSSPFPRRVAHPEGGSTPCMMRSPNGEVVSPPQPPPSVGNASVRDSTRLQRSASVWEQSRDVPASTISHFLVIF